jgi:hypothetical protein
MAFKFPSKTNNRLHSAFRNLVSKEAAEAITIPALRCKSFVNDELRPYAMKLHTRDQSREGLLKPQLPYTQWEPTTTEFLQYLTDSKAVFEMIEQSVDSNADLKAVKVSGLERTSALTHDIDWMLHHNPTLHQADVGSAGRQYTAFLNDLLNRNDIPAFICHFYNIYFALTAGGTKIGKFMSSKLLGGKRLEFYTFTENEDSVNSNINIEIENVSGSDETLVNASSGDVGTTADLEHTATSTTSYTTPYSSPYIKSSTDVSTTATSQHAESLSTKGMKPTTHTVDFLKEELRQKIDAIAKGWTLEERQHCCNETDNCFKFGNELLAYLHGDVKVV